MAKNQPDWPTGDEAEEALPPVAPVAPVATGATATAATAPAAAKEPAVHPGWTGGNVGNVTQTPQIAGLHPDADGEAEEALPQPPAPKGPSKFALPSPLPASYAACYALLQKLKGIPATTEKENEERNECLAVFGKHFHALQQGLPTTQIGSVAYGNTAAKHNEVLTGQRREMAAQGDMVVKELLEDFKALEKRALALRNELALALKENADLHELLNAVK